MAGGGGVEWRGGNKKTGASAPVVWAGVALTPGGGGEGGLKRSTPQRKQGGGEGNGAVKEQGHVNGHGF